MATGAAARAAAAALRPPRRAARPLRKRARAARASLHSEGTPAEPVRTLVVTSDVAGDAHAADVIRELGEGADVRVVAGPRAIAAAGGGENQHVSTRGLSSIGLAHAVPLVRQALGTMRRARRLVREFEPHAILLIDFPGVNIPLGTQVRKARGDDVHPRIIYYIPPNEWHVTAARSADVVRAADEVLCVHPREHAHFAAVAKRTNAKCEITFVGHPVATRVLPAKAWTRSQARAALGVPEKALSVALLPASRLQEALHVWPATAAAAHRLFLHHRARRHGFDGLSVQGFAGASHGDASLSSDVVFLLVLPAGAPKGLEARLREHAAWFFDAHESAGRLRVLRGEVLDVDVELSHAAAVACDVALCKTGTVGLELFLLNAPQVAVYVLDSLSASVLKLLLRLRGQPMDSFLANLPNVIAGERIVPELLQEKATPEAIAIAALEQVRGDGHTGDGDADTMHLRDVLGSKLAAREVAIRVAAAAHLL